MSGSPQNVNITIASAEDLSRALRLPDVAQRGALLQSIRRTPEKAMAFGMANGRDLVDELLVLCEESRGSLDRLDYLYTVFSLADARVNEFAKREFLTAADPKVQLLAASRLTSLPPEELTGFLAPVVMDSRDATRGRAAANLLAGCGQLEIRVALRVAILSDHNVPVPPLNATTLDDWINELNGPYPRASRKLLLRVGNEALLELLSHWARLPDDVCIWILRKGLACETPGIARQIRETVRHGKGELLRTALDLLAKLPRDAHDEVMLAPLYTQHDTAVRVAAIAAGQEKLDWLEFLSGESEDEVRLAIIERMGRCGGQDEVALLSELLDDADWRIRAQATSALVALAPASLTFLRNSLTDSSERVRVAAANGLYRLGKEEWVVAILEGNPS